MKKIRKCFECKHCYVNEIMEWYECSHPEISKDGYVMIFKDKIPDSCPI